VFVLGQRFDFVTFDSGDSMPTRGEMNELGTSAQLQTIANSRALAPIESSVKGSSDAQAPHPSYSHRDRKPTGFQL